MGNFTSGLRNIVTHNAQVLPVQEGSRLFMPLNYATPNVHSGSNMFQYVYVEGLHFPTVELNLLVTKDWLTAANLAKWFARQADDDVLDAGPLVYWDGVVGVSASASKVALLTIGASLGQALLRCKLTIVGAGTVDKNAAKPNVSEIDSNPAGFQHVALSGGLSTTPNAANAAAGWDLVISNNLDMCPELNGTTAPSEHNAGQLTASMRLVMQAKATRPPNGTACEFSITPPAGNAVTITAKNPLCPDPYDRAVQSVRQMKEHNYILLGESPVLPPVTFA